MIKRLNVPARVALGVLASIPAWGFAQSPPPPAPQIDSVPVVEAPKPVVVIPAGISPEVWHHVVAAHAEALRGGKTTSPIVTIIDYSRPATEKRLWVVTMTNDSLLANEFVAHGEGSGGLVPTKFSNRDGSHQSSLGTFITGERFYGVRGRSLPLHGLEEGINDNAYTRGLLIHGTRTVSEAKALEGRMGLTEGCAGVPRESAKRLINLIGTGTMVFVWYPDPGFLKHSAYLDENEVTERLAALD